MELLDQTIERVGGVGKLAQLLGVRQSTVSNWRARSTPIPVEHCANIEGATAGAVRRWDLRPLDWHRIWPELIGADGAPDVPEPPTQPGALSSLDADAPVSQAGELNAA